MKSNELIEVAKLGRVVGLKGYLKLHNLGDFPEQFKKGASFSTSKNEKLTIQDYDKNRDLVLFVGLADRENAAKYTNEILCTTKEETRKNCKLKSGEFFWFDVVDCEIIDSGVKLGTVDEIERIAEQNYLHVKTDESFTKDGFMEFFLIPYIDRYVKNTDIKTKQITTVDAIDFLEKV
ncbi:MAG: ribosome maturation factor RimM [Campylobacteraceae bacterium]